MIFLPKTALEEQRSINLSFTHAYSQQSIIWLAHMWIALKGLLKKAWHYMMKNNFKIFFKFYYGTIIYQGIYSIVMGLQCSNNPMTSFQFLPPIFQVPFQPRAIDYCSLDFMLLVLLAPCFRYIDVPHL